MRDCKFTYGVEFNGTLHSHTLSMSKRACKKNGGTVVKK